MESSEVQACLEHSLELLLNEKPKEANECLIRLHNQLPRKRNLTEVIQVWVYLWSAQRSQGFKAQTWIRKIHQEVFQKKSVNLEGVAGLFNNLGAKYLERRLPQSAIECLQHALQLKQRINNLRLQLKTLINLGTAQALGCFDEEALKTCEAIAALTQQINNADVISEAKEKIMVIHRMVNNIPTAMVPEYQLTEWSTLRQIITSIEYLPLAFENCICSIDNMQIDIVNANTFKISFDLKLSYDVRDEEFRPYEVDAWKAEHVFHTAPARINTIPYFVVYLDENSYVTDITILDPRGRRMTIEMGTRNWVFILPKSYPLMGQTPIPIGKKKMFVKGRGAAFFWQPASDTSFRIRFTVHSQNEQIIDTASKTFGLFFPFRRAIIKNYSIDTPYYVQLCHQNLSFIPYITTDVPNVDIGGSILCELSSEPIETGQGVTNSFQFTDYNVLKIDITSRPSQPYGVEVIATGYPIPSGLYDLISHDDVAKLWAISFNYWNRSEEIKVFRLVARFENGEEESKIVKAEPNQSSTVKLTPPLPLDISNQTVVQSLRLTSKVYLLRNDGPELVWEDTARVQILPKDVFLFWIRNPITSAIQHDFSEYLAAWVTPRAVEYLLSDVANLHPDGVLGGYQDEIEPQIRAIYDMLNQRGIRYSTSANIDTSPRNDIFSQRIRLPSQSLQLGLKLQERKVESFFKNIRTV